MNYSFRRKLISFFTACSFLLAPTLPAFATSANLDYNTLCPATATAGTAATSDQTSSYCAQAATARTTESFQKAKEVLMMTAGATLTALAFLPIGGEAACKPIALGADAAGLGIDVAQSLKEKSISSAMTTGMSSIGAGYVALNGIGNNAVGRLADSVGAGNSNLANGTNQAGSKNTTHQMDQKQGCVVSAAMSFVQAATSMFAVSSAKTAEQSALSSVGSLDSARASNGFSAGGAVNVAPSTGTVGTAQAAATTSGTCAGKSGSDYLQCLSNGDAVAAALTSDPSVVSAMQGALGGKDPAAFAQGYTGDGSPASVAGYVGGGMGMKPDNIAALQKAMDISAQAAADKGLSGGGAGAFVASSGSVGQGSNDMDFSKMMSGLMKQMAPDANKKGEDPSSIVFRQLDLLPASKIENNKDISLFARVGYRYQKANNGGYVDQLNWSAPQNQSTMNLAPAVSNNARLPASKN